MTSDPIVVCEVYYDPPLNEEREAQLFPRLHECLTARSQRWLGSIASADGRMTLCTFAGSDVERVREAYETAGIPAHRVFLAHHVKPA